MAKAIDAGQQAEVLIRRMRAWSASSWRHGDRITVVREAGQRLADLAAEREGRASRPVPDHGSSALSDQLAVLLADALRAGVPEDRLDAILTDVRSRLGFRS